MILYHGGSIPVKEPRIVEPKYPKDFGPGFYCTQFHEQAIRWAQRYETPTVSKYLYDTDVAALKELKILLFNEMTEEWLDFIVHSRSGRTHDYDVVSGAMANDQIFNYIADFISGILTRDQFWVLSRFKYPTQQICFCSVLSLQCLSYLGATR